MNSPEPNTARLLQGPRAPDSPSPSLTAKKRSVLFVDDDQAIRLLWGMMLARAGYIVTVAADGEAAWSELLSAPYDLLITDHNMPRLCGLDLVARMRAAGMTLPVIIHSGSLEMREVPDYPALDLAAVLHKPFGIHELLDVVKRILPLASVEKAGATGNVPPETSPAVPLHFPGRNLTPLPSRIDSTQPHSNTMQPSSSRARHQPWTAPMPTPEPVSAPPKRVLIADDDALVRGSLAAVLESEGFVTAEAKNGAEAVTRAIEHTPDLVLLDLNMPRWDGWTAFSQLDRVTPLLPVIVITARPNQYQKAMQLGVDAFMEKPLDIAALVQAIKRLTSEDEHRHVRRITSPAFVTQLLGCPESR